MRIREVACQQRMLGLGIRDVRWESLPKSVQKEVITLLSLVILDYARAGTGVEGRE